MRIVHLSHNVVSDYRDPEAWLKRLDFFTGILEATTKYATVKSFYRIAYTGELERNGVFYQFENPTRWQQWLPFRLHAHVKAFDPDVVIIHGLIFPLQLLLLRIQLLRKVKIIAQHHAERPFRGIRKVLHWLVDRYVIDAYFFSAYDLAEAWVKHGLIEKRKIREVMPVSSPFYALERNEARSVTSVSGNPVFLWVGRLHVYKNPLLAVRGFMRFAREMPSARLYMIYQSYELLNELQLLMANKEAAQAIHLVGKVEHQELLNWYNSADFIISTSIYESGGAAVCEAMSCGCIPVLSSIPSFRTITGNGACGLLFEPDDEESLFRALLRCQQIDRKKERDKVLQQFADRLSFQAIARDTYQAIVS